MRIATPGPPHRRQAITSGRRAEHLAELRRVVLKRARLSRRDQRTGGRGS